MENKKLEKEKKEKVDYIGTAFLLGKRREDNKKVYLEAGEWNCSWYWGFCFGCLSTYNKSKTDYDERYHFDDFLEDIGLDGIEKHFKTFVLSGEEIWELADLMKSCSILNDVAEYFHAGHSNYSDTRPRKNDLLCQKMNLEIRVIIKRVEKLLTI